MPTDEQLTRTLAEMAGFPALHTWREETQSLYSYDLDKHFSPLTDPHDREPLVVKHHIDTVWTNDYAGDNPLWHSKPQNQTTWRIAEDYALSQCLALYYAHTGERDGS